MIAQGNGNHSELLTTVSISDAEHGTDIAEGYRSVSSASYWRFFRISPHLQIELINFLKEHNYWGN